MAPVHQKQPGKGRIDRRIEVPFFSVRPSNAPTKRPPQHSRVDRKNDLFIVDVHKMQSTPSPSIQAVQKRAASQQPLSE